MDQKLVELTRQEVEKLKAHATEEERANLSLQKLNAFNTRNCIYGQMTGNCHSERALELLNLCAIAYSGNLQGLSTNEELIFGCRMFSALECYITQPDAKKKELIEYIKGEAETLKL